MFCIQCGKEIADNSKFCPNCGAQITATVNESTAESVTQAADTQNTETPIKEDTEQSSVSNESSQSNEQLSDWQVSYQKNKMIGLVTYKRVHTDVTLTTTEISISKKAGRKKEEKKAPLSEIQSIAYKKTYDFWDTLYAVIFTLLTVCCLLCKNWGGAGGLGLSAAVCFFCGIGKEIAIQFQDGSVFHIPVKLQSEVDDFAVHVSQYAHREIPATLSGSQVKAGSTSKKKKLFLIGGIVAVVLVLLIVVSLGAKETTADGYENELGLNGEYAIALDASLDEGYMYLNFNYDGSGTLKLYTSDDPTAIFEGEYEVLPVEDGSEWLDLYILKIDDIDLLTLYSIGDNEFGIEFSEEIDENNIGGVMVPFTEEYGFGGSSEENTLPQGQNLPAWCNGSYYGNDLYSKIAFDEESGLNIFIYRLVSIKDCVITQQGENQISFTGKFDIDVGSVSGTLTNYGSDTTLVITESDWSYFPAGTMMEFYYDYKDPNYLNHKDHSDAYGMTGIYASTDIPANRVFVWENDNTIYLSLTNRGESIDILELSAGDMNRASDIVYFSSYTLSGEILSGSFDPAAELLELWSEDASTLMAYGVDGLFLKQVD